MSTWQMHPQATTFSELLPDEYSQVPNGVLKTEQGRGGDLPPHFEPQNISTIDSAGTVDSHTTTEMSTTTPRINLLDLPLELHIQVASFLSYPDALALKHSCSHFYYMVYTGVHLKVDWLVERFERKLECPMEKCSFRTDEAFCNWRIRRIMERRRQHLECRRSPRGCWVVEGQTCQSDLVPLWLKRKGPRRIVRSLAMIGREALIVGFFAILLELLWQFTRSHVVDWLLGSVAEGCA